MNNKLFNAILSMDAYNRGYNPGIELHLPAATVNQHIGNATIIRQSDFTAGTQGYNSSFYALAYDYNGQTIVSYRGTDDPIGTITSSFFGSDIWDGWFLGGGI